jgi:hypothetical protein
VDERDQKAMSLLLSQSAGCIRGFEAWILWTLLLKSTLIPQTLMVTSCTIIIHNHKSCVLLTECIFLFCVLSSMPLQNFSKLWRLKINGTYQFLVYHYGVNILAGNIHTIKKNSQTSVVASQEVRLEWNVETIQYMVASGGQNAGQNVSQNIKR